MVHVLLGGENYNLVHYIELGNECCWSDEANCEQQNICHH